MATGMHSKRCWSMLPREIDAWWVLGDLAAIGPDPVGTVEVVANLPHAEFVRGNTDRYVLTDDRLPPHAEEVAENPELLPLFALIQRSFAWTAGALAAHGWMDWLDGLPNEVRTTLPDRTTVLGVHASPGCDDGEGITPHHPTAELLAALAGADAQVVFAGHTHQPTDRVVGEVRAVNLGSVSNPITDDLRASYVVLHADRHGHTIEHHRVDYGPRRLPVRGRRVRSSGVQLHRVVPAGSAGPLSRSTTRRPQASYLTYKNWRPAGQGWGLAARGGPAPEECRAAQSGCSI
jgi:predicted phosphodiesterase